jgi:hypothetical protein
MNISITSIRKASSEEWDSIWHRCEYATYFHSREWAETWNVYSHGKIQAHPLLVTFSDSKRVLLPLSKQERLKGIVSICLSSPAGTFGGWISSDEIEVPHAELLGAYLTNEVDNLVWRINPYDKSALYLLENGLEVDHMDETQTLFLDDGFEGILKMWTKEQPALLRAVRKAQKGGVTIKFTDTQDDWQAYYRIYEDSLRRWGKKVAEGYGPKLFESFYLRKSSHIKLWLAMSKETILAGALCFYASKHVVYWHGAALEKYFAVRPINLLMFEIIKDACNNNYTWFDFNPSGGYKGVMHFKNSFGPVLLPCPVVEKNTPLNRIIKMASGLFR